MERCMIFAVSSVRNYGDGELYFGTDGLFRTRSEAVDYIRKDIREMLRNYLELYEDETLTDCVDEEGDDFCDFSIRLPERTFLWRIDVFNTDRFLASDKSAAREFFIDTPLGKLHVWAKHDRDCADDYPGVYVDLVNFWDLDGECDDMLACVEYDSADRVLQTCVYQPGIDEPVSIVRHESRVDEVR